MASRVEYVVGTFPTQLDEISQQYERSLANKEVSEGLLHEVARLTEDCLRVCDWTASDLDHKFGQGADRSPYFPLHKDPTKFASAVARHFGSIPANVHQAMERHQPFQPGKELLEHLHDLADPNKHQDFTAQTRMEHRRITASAPGGGSVSWTPYTPGQGGVRFGSGVSINGVPVDPTTQRPVASPTQTVTETVFVSISFAKQGLLVVPTLDTLTRLVTDLVSEVRHEAGL